MQQYQRVNNLQNLLLPEDYFMIDAYNFQNLAHRSDQYWANGQTILGLQNLAYRSDQYWDNGQMILRL